MELEDVIETDHLDEQRTHTHNERKVGMKFNTLLCNILVAKLRGEELDAVSSVHDDDS